MLNTIVESLLHQLPTSSPTVENFRNVILKPPASSTRRLVTTPQCTFGWPSVSTPVYTSSLPETAGANWASPAQTRIINNCSKNKFSAQIRENWTLKIGRERSSSRAPFPDILLRSGSNNFKFGSQHPNPRGPGHIRMNKWFPRTNIL